MQYMFGALILCYLAFGVANAQGVSEKLFDEPASKTIAAPNLSDQRFPDNASKKAKRLQLAGYSETGEQSFNLLPLISSASSQLDRTAGHSMVKANCSARFDVDERGVPFNIQPDCNDKFYDLSAVEAVAAIRLKPILVDGAAIIQHDLSVALTPVTIAISQN